MRDPYALTMLIRDLEWLTALAEHGHLTETAARLGVSQPTLTRALARVERELGARLFERLPGGVHLNPDGELVIAAAREITERHDQLVAELTARLDPEAGIVRLAFLDSIATSLVPEALRTFHEQAPRNRLQLRQEPAHEIVRDLDRGDADVAITSPRPEGAFGWAPLHEERLVLVVPRGHRWRHRRRISVAELADEELVTTPVGFGYRALVAALLAEAGIAPRISFESGDLATTEALVAAGLGVAVLPEQFAGLSGTVGIRLASAAARRTIGLTWRSDRILAPAASRFLELVIGDHASA
jgi:DNA-binding transcriptional LysR family regulator